MRAVKELVNALNPQKKVFILGSAFVDMILSVHEMPHAGADIEGKFKKTVVGGCSFNVADVLWKLGLPFDSICLWVKDNLPISLSRHSLGATFPSIVSKEQATTVGASRLQTTQESGPSFRCLAWNGK